MTRDRVDNEANSPKRWWLFGATLMLVLLAWLLVDPQFDSGIRTVGSWLRPESDVETQSPVRATLLVALGGLAVGSIARLSLGLFTGTRRHRRLDSLFVLVALIAGWIAIAAGLGDLLWHAKRLRTQSLPARLEPIAEDLHRHWPTGDGGRPLLGPFMAYPIDDPAMLMLLKPTDVERRGVAISAVERSSGGALRFQLAGSERGDWIEWHPPGSVPSSFIGGLLTNFKLVRSDSLTDGWYLARYVER